MTFYSGQNGRMELYEPTTATGPALAVAFVNNGQQLTQTGAQTGIATTVETGDSGSGLTIDFEVNEGECEQLTINTPGTGYSDDQVVNVPNFANVTVRIFRREPRRLAKVASWQIQTSASTLDTTTLGDTDSTCAYGLRESSGSARIFYYDQGGTNDCAVLMKKLLKVRNNLGDPEFAGVADEPEPVRLKLDVMHGTTTKCFEFVALITSASMVMGVGEVLAADIQFKVQGAFESLTVLN